MVGPAGVLPGWYQDPSGDYEQRWWDGTAWTDRVVTGSFTTDDPVTEPGPLPAEEVVLWQTGGDVLTTHRLIIASTLPKRPPEQFEVWMVAGTRARHSGVGDVEITIAFAGYGGRATWVLRRVSDPPAVAALVRKQANRARRSFPTAGAPAPSTYGAAALTPMSRAPQQYGTTW